MKVPTAFRRLLSDDACAMGVPPEWVLRAALRAWHALDPDDQVAGVEAVASLERSKQRPPRFDPRVPEAVHAGRPPTARQREALRALVRLSRGGIGPSRREIGDALGGIREQAVTDLLMALARRGLVTWQPRKARTLRLTPEGERVVGVRAQGEDGE